MANLFKTGKDIHPFPQQDYKSNFKIILHSLKQTHIEKNIVTFRTAGEECRSWLFNVCSGE